MVSNDIAQDKDSSQAMLNWSNFVRYYANPELKLRLQNRRPRFLLRGFRNKAQPDPDSEPVEPEPVFETGVPWGHKWADDQGLSENDPKKKELYLWDEEYAILDPRTLAMRYTQDHRMVFFRKGRPTKANDFQKRIVCNQNKKLNELVKQWEETNLTEQQKSDVAAWFVDWSGRSAEVVESGSDDAPPFHKFNRYRLMPTSANS